MEVYVIAIPRVKGVNAKISLVSPGTLVCVIL